MDELASIHMWSNWVACSSCRVVVYEEHSTVEVTAKGEQLVGESYPTLDQALDAARRLQKNPTTKVPSPVAGVRSAESES